jgi:hypothetical protein
MTVARNCYTLFASALSVYVLRSNKIGNGELLGLIHKCKTDSQLIFSKLRWAKQYYFQTYIVDYYQNLK